VFSFRNEEATLPELIRRVRAALEPLPLDHELVFVNDASTDGSFGLLRAEAAADRRVKVVTLSRRFGVVPAFLAGFRYASGDAVVTMDADLQDPPELLPTLIEKWRAGADVVYTTRTERQGESFLRPIATGVAYRLIRSLSEVELPVEAGMFRLVSRRALDQVLAIPEREAYLRGLTMWVGFRQEGVPYVRDARFAGEAHFHYLGVAAARELMAAVTSFSKLPLISILVLGAVTAGFALAALAFFLLRALLGTPAAPLLLAAVALALLAGVQIACLGIVALYVGRIYNQVRGRPEYVVDSLLNLAQPVAAGAISASSSSAP
jgi:dolichol-phosphate mannosyltransferase